MYNSEISSDRVVKPPVLPLVLYGYTARSGVTGCPSDILVITIFYLVSAPNSFITTRSSGSTFLQLLRLTCTDQNIFIHCFEELQRNT